jgi:hypothetical protein
MSTFRERFEDMTDACFSLRLPLPRGGALNACTVLARRLERIATSERDFRRNLGGPFTT